MRQPHEGRAVNKGAAVRVLLRLLVATTSVLVADSPVLTGHASLVAHADRFRDPVADLAHVERLLHAVPLAEFVRIVSAGDRWFDVSTDWCSAPLVGSTGRSFDFRAPCRRHDFGYRNLQLLDARYSCPRRPPGQVCASTGSPGTYWNTRSRRRVDQRFLDDMRGHCRSRPWHESAACLGWAETFSTAVRTFGGP
jgi:hypothetical protein